MKLTCYIIVVMQAVVYKVIAHGQCFSCTLLSDEDDLLDVTNYLQYMEKTHIYNLGLVLGLRHMKVKNMKDTSDTFLDDVIAAWLQKQDKVTEKGEPSWTVLINALKHPRVGQTGIANNIAKDKEHITSPVATSLCRGNAEVN